MNWRPVTFSGGNSRPSLDASRALPSQFMLSPDRQSDSLFPQEQPPLPTPLLDVDILDVSAMTLNAFANYRTIRILTYSTSLYKRYLSLIIDRIPQHSEDLASFDWLQLSSSTISEILCQHATLPAWASSTLWAQHANARFDHISAQLDTLLDPASRQPSRAKVTANSWYASKDRVHPGLMLDSFGRPTFDWKTLPSNLVVDNESTPDKLVLDRHETQAFIGRDLTPSRWRRLLRNS